MKKFILIVLIFAFKFAFSEVPLQFQVWGKLGDDMIGVPPGYTEVTKEDKGSGLDLKDEEKSQGFVVFARHPQELIYVYTKPSTFEKINSIKLFSCPGEYEPITFSLYGLKDANAKVKVSELTSKEGKKITAENFDVRVVTNLRRKVSEKSYSYWPFILEKPESFKITNGKTTQVWITMFVPKDTAAGV